MTPPPAPGVPSPRTVPAVTAPDDADVLRALREGDDRVVAEFVRGTTPLLLTLARRVVGDQAAAEDVVQDTWLVVLQGHGGFAGRSSLRTWVVGTMLNVARRRRARDRRLLPVPDPHLWGAVRAAPDPTLPEVVLLARELRGHVERAVVDLPGQQAAVVRLRDLLDLDADEVCQVLTLTPGNQRVLLHRGRSQVRRSLSGYLDTSAVSA